jgi:hypothetical protein
MPPQPELLGRLQRSGQAAHLDQDERAAHQWTRGTGAAGGATPARQAILAISPQAR